MGFPAHSVVQTVTLHPLCSLVDRFSGYTKPPRGCNLYIVLLEFANICMV